MLKRIAVVFLGAFILSFLSSLLSSEVRDVLFYAMLTTIWILFVMGYPFDEKPQAKKTKSVEDEIDGYWK